MTDPIQVVVDNIFAGHVHLRGGHLLEVTIPLNSPHSCVVHIPNLQDPIDSGEKLAKHQDEIMSHKPDFQIIWGIMLTKRTTKEGILHAYNLGARFIKYIPADASTHSTSAIGITIDEFPSHYDLLGYALSLGMAVLIHAERIRTKKGIVIPFEQREEAAISDVGLLISEFPGEKIRIEHVSTRAMLEFLNEKNIKKALTPQHVRKTFAQVFDAMGNTIPENFCMPILKPHEDVLAIRKEMVLGNHKFTRYGPDDAIHEWFLGKITNKMPGLLVPPRIALPIICEIFSGLSGLKFLSEFLSFGEADKEFFGVKLEVKKRVVLIRKPWIVPETLFGRYVPFMHGERLNWQIKEVANL